MERGIRAIFIAVPMQTPFAAAWQAKMAPVAGRH
jgi:hypothetical protein